jgi:membrane associated rhomboid family serine protease
MNHSRAWRDLRGLPSHDLGGYAYWRGRGVDIPDFGEAQAALRNWNPLSRILVAGPRSRRFLPPVCDAGLRPSVMRALRRNVLLAIGGWGALGLILCLTAFLGGARRHLPFAILCFLVTATFLVDYANGLKHPTAVAERALYFRWLQTARSPRTGFAFFVALMVVAGVAQLVLQSRLGSLDAFVEAYGIVFTTVREGEMWRLATGIFIHSGSAHFLSNLFLLALIAPIAWGVVGGVTSTAIFLFACMAGAAAQMQFGTTDFDSYLGVSPGVFALFGVVLVYGAFEKKLLPRGLGWLLAGLVLVSGVGAQLVSGKSASVAHLTGFLLGGVLGTAHIALVRVSSRAGHGITSDH